MAKPPPTRQPPADADGPGARAQPNPDAGLRALLQEIVSGERLAPLFQPIFSLGSGEAIGFEGLIRGPADSPLHLPFDLFAAARAHGLETGIERLCRRIVLERFAAQSLPGKLFLNVSPGLLLNGADSLGLVEDRMLACGIGPERVIIELTEHQPAHDYALLREAVSHFRSLGFQIAIDDLGEGFSSLRLWSELRPEYVKLDRHFIQGINLDPVKLQFVRSIQEIARNSAACIIAEGIESQAELHAVMALGLAYGQGNFIGRPDASPGRRPSEDSAAAFAKTGGEALHGPALPKAAQATAVRLVRAVEPVAPDTRNDRIFELFKSQPELQSVPVVIDGYPLGIINRYTTIERFAHRYWRDLYGRKSCTALIDFEPVIVDRHVGIQELSRIMVTADQRQLTNGFIVTEQGRYLGVGTGHDLMAEITKMQIDAAKYANPLTQLPGNVPINEHIDRLLQIGSDFVACYCDLDHFKPFNDVYGYRKGDEVIQRLGLLLSGNCDPERDFLGHIGGDDFIILFRSADWERRCQAILEGFAHTAQDLFSGEDRARGGYHTEDRQGNKVFCPLVSLSLGVVEIEASERLTQHQISTSVAEAKKQAKKMPGNSIFIERRRIGNGQAAPHQPQLPF